MIDEEGAGRVAYQGRTLTYGLVDTVGRAVVAGEYEQRPFPTEADLAKQYGVSRSVTREAMKMLAAKGMLSARPRQGTVIVSRDQWNLFDPDILRWLLDRKLSVGLLEQFNELRLGVEPQAAALAAKRARPVQVAAIAAGLDRMRAAEKGLDDALEADIEFHVAILRASGNPFYEQVKDIVTIALTSSIRFTNRLSGRTANISDHASVYSAIVAGNEKAAADAMHKLIEDVLDLMRTIAKTAAAE